jgi:hypothetical protein
MNVRGLLRKVLEECQKSVTVARADVAAVEDVLHGQVDVDTLGTASDLDAVRQG